MLQGGGAAGTEASPPRTNGPPKLDVTRQLSDYDHASSVESCIKGSETENLSLSLLLGPG